MCNHFLSVCGVILIVLLGMGVLYYICSFFEFLLDLKKRIERLEYKIIDEQVLTKLSNRIFELESKRSKK